MTGKRCTDCKYTKGIGYDFWCGEGHTEYEVFGAETNCPYYEYHDWSKGIPSSTEKRFTYDSKTVSILKDGEFWLDGNIDTACNHSEICNELNNLADENEQLKKVFRELITSGYWDEDYLTEQDWNDLKRYIENVFEKVMMND